MVNRNTVINAQNWQEALAWSKKRDCLAELAKDAYVQKVKKFNYDISDVYDKS